MAPKNFICDQCGGVGSKRAGCVNRSRRQGNNLFCGRHCYYAYVAANKVPKAVQKERKAEYDRWLRADPIRGEASRQQKRKHYAANAQRIYRENRARMEADPERMARYRAKQAAIQNTPEAKKAKKAYDRRWRAVREFGEGPMADAWVLLGELLQEIKERQPDHWRLMNEKGRLNGHNQRRKL